MNIILKYSPADSHLKKLFFLFSFIILLTSVFGQKQIISQEDCYIFAGGVKANNTYGVLDRDTLITRKSVASAEFTRETYILFNIGTADTTYTSIVLKLYGKVLESKKVQVYSTDTSWLEETLTGSTRPAGTFIVEKTVDPGEDYYFWDVTDFVNLAFKNGQQRVAFVLRDVAGAVSTKDTKWHSKENASGHTPILEFTEGPVAIHRNGPYYIDAVAGNDDNPASSPAEAWQSLDKINQTSFEPGDSILFKSGCSWQGSLTINGSGHAGKPIVVSSYGEGDKPLIEGMGLAENTVQFTNQQYFEINNLHITNLGPVVAFRRALYILEGDQGAVKNIVLRNLEISDVNGSMDGEISKNNGGIFLEITGSLKPTWFDSLLIENCYIHDVDRTGCSNKSSWSSRTLTTNTNWVPSVNVIIRNNVFENTGANGLIVRVARKPLMEYNLFTHCASKGSGNASFNFNTDSAVWQYNEACYTVYNAGDADAGGFDSDYDTKYTIIQYNYSHDNEFGALLLTGGPASSNGFNDRTIIRYNVLVNNKDHVIRTSGMATNASIYNNTIITESELPGTILILHKSWEGYSENTKYYNNIFHTLATGAYIDLGASTGNAFDYNTFSGLAVSGTPSDPHKLTSDPMFEGDAEILNRFDSCLIYRIRQGSPAINSGKTVLGNAEFDIIGNPVPYNIIPDRGAFEYTGPDIINVDATESKLIIFPNPVLQDRHLNIKGVPSGKTVVEVYSSDGRHLWTEDYLCGSGQLGLNLNLSKLQLSSGIYFLRALCSDMSVKQANFSIQ
jgi:hypothetical protein